MTCRDERVTGAALINGLFLDGPESHEIAAMARDRTQARYYWRRISSPGSWWRLLTGRSDWQRLLETARSILFHGAAMRQSRTQPRTSLIGEAIAKQKRLLFVYADGSPSHEAFRIQHEKLVRATSASLHVISNCDHVFTLLWSQEVLQRTVVDWITGYHVSPRQDHQA